MWAGGAGLSLSVLSWGCQVESHPGLVSVSLGKVGACLAALGLCHSVPPSSGPLWVLWEWLGCPALRKSGQGLAGRWKLGLSPWCPGDQVWMQR